MTYAARDDTTLPKLLAQMRWVVLVDKRQLAVLLLENEGPVASARTRWIRAVIATMKTSRSTQWSGYVGVWLTRRCVSGVLCRASSRSSDQVSTCG